MAFGALRVSLLVGCSLSLLNLNAHASDTEITAKIGLEALNFFEGSNQPDQKAFYGSFSIEPELYTTVNENSEIKAKLFYRNDAQSESRTHADIRELMYYRYADDWELNIGIGKVFWGVTESRHVVDVINQIDNIESLDDEQRLGQAMLQAKLIRDWGTLDLFVLPYFREVNFGKKDLRPNVGLDVIDPLYQAHSEQRHVDWAARWLHTMDELDIGLSYFNGTQRNPLLTAVPTNNGIALRPVYVQQQQFGIDAQYILEDWLLKLEGVARNSHKYNVSDGFYRYRSHALVTGFEYTLYGIHDSNTDLGLIGEYLYDEWHETTFLQKEWMTGIRWVWNDEQSTEWLLGNFLDLDDGTQIWQLEASRRISDSWKASATARWATSLDPENEFASFMDNQGLVSIKLDYYF